MEFNEKLQELRKQKGLTQEELAEALYVFQGGNVPVSSLFWTKGGWCDSGGLTACIDRNRAVCENTVSDHCLWDKYMGYFDTCAAKL